MARLIGRAIFMSERDGGAQGTRKRYRALCQMGVKR